jgi:hypothetical protein
MKVLVSGWFSFEKMGTTAGDLIVCGLVCSWLRKAGINFEVAAKRQFYNGIDWEKADPSIYSHVIFACGPFGNGWPITEFINHFKNCKFIGLNLSMLQALNQWDPFELLIERDSNLRTNADIAFGAELQKVPIVGIIRAHKQKEYGELSRHELANSAIDELIASREMATINIDTAVEDNKYGLKTPREIESLIARTDVVITTRLHGLVLSLKNGIPAVAIDPIAGGAKITRQAIAINWPYHFKVNEIDSSQLMNAFDACLKKEAVHLVYQVAAYGKMKVKDIETKLLDYFSIGVQHQIQINQ